MKKNQNDLIDRYIQEVVKRVPQKQREDIDLELRGLIDDELSAQENMTIEAVLIKLGNPSQLADNFLDQKRYLIGPSLLDLYLMLLKIVIPSVILALTIALTVAFIAIPDQSAGEFVLSLVGSWWSASLQVFAFMTIGFAIAERVSGGKIKEEQWTPSMLPEKVETNQKVNIKEAIAGIIFAIIIMVIFNVTPNFIAIYQFNPDLVRIPLLNETVYPTVLLWINIGFVLMIIKEIVKMIVGRYSMKLVITQSLIGLVSVIVAVLLLSMTNLINPTINADLLASGFIVDIDSYQWLNRLRIIVMMIVIVVYLIESGLMFFKQFKHARKSS